MTERLFPIEDVPEVPIFREPRRRGAAAGSVIDARFKNDYPPAWDRCPGCEGHGLIWGNLRPGSTVIESGAEVQFAWRVGDAEVVASRIAEDGVYAGELIGHRLRDKVCPECKGMGSVKARVRLEAGFRCLRCRHPYVPKGDAEKARLLPSWEEGGWSECDEKCFHGGPMRVWTTEGWSDFDPTPEACGAAVYAAGKAQAAWRILTVHHADGDKANLAWWNLLALCQRCHLEIQAKVVMERVYPHEHSEWFKPFVAGYYAHVYLDEGHLSREKVEARLDELLNLERAVPA